MLTLLLALAGAVPPELSTTGTSHLCWFSELDQTEWNTTAGNEPGEGDHFGSDYYALDYNTDTYDADCGTVAYPACAGTVLWAGTTDPGGDPEGAGDNGYGYQVIVQCEDDPEFAFRHSHLESFSVAVHAEVGLDDPLGTIGNTGNSSACHDHLVVYRNISMVSPDYAPSTGLQRLEIGRAPTPLSGPPNIFSAPFALDADCSSPVVCEDADGDGFLDSSCAGLDCDDTDATVFPGAPELCDSIDNNCQGDAGFGQIDEACDDVGDPDMQWLPTVNLTSLFGIQGEHPKLGSGDDGVVHLLMPQWSGRDRLYHATVVDSSWSIPRRIPGFADWCTSPSLVVDPGGVPHVGVSLCGNTGDDSLDRAFYTTRPVSSWLPAQQVSPRGFAHNTVLVLSGGVMHMAWQESDTDQLLSSRWVNGTWTAPQILSEGIERCYSYDLAAGPNDTVHALLECRANSDMQYAVWDGSWSTPVVMATDAQAASHAQIGVEPDGTVHAVWNKSFSGHRVRYSRLDAGGWSPQETISGPEVARHPAMHVDRQGTAHVLWQGLGSGQPYRIEYRRLDEQGWSDVLELDQPGDWVAELDLTTDVDGAVHTVWSAQAPSGRVVGYRRTAAPPPPPPTLATAITCLDPVVGPGGISEVEVSITNVHDQDVDFSADISILTCDGTAVPFRSGGSTLAPGDSAVIQLQAQVPSNLGAANRDCDLTWRLQATDQADGQQQDESSCAWQVATP